MQIEIQPGRHHQTDKNAERHKNRQSHKNINSNKTNYAPDSQVLRNFCHTPDSQVLWNFRHPLLQSIKSKIMDGF